MSVTNSIVGQLYLKNKYSRSTILKTNNLKKSSDVWLPERVTVDGNWIKSVEIHKLPIIK